MPKKIKNKQSLAEAHPGVAAQWDRTKNSINPEDVFSFSSHKKVWWRCLVSNDHEWEAQISSIVKSFKNKTNTKGCPFCQGSKVTKSNCLATTDPEIAKSWHLTKNELTANDVTRCSNQKAWWLCAENSNHEWKATVNNRIKQNCPYCSGKRVSIESSLAAKFPQLANEWHPTKNQYTSKEVTAGSNKYAWWICENNHEYRTKICHRTSGSGCPYCTGIKLSEERALAHKRPDLAKEFHLTKNFPLTTSTVFSSSGTKVWWQCLVDQSHEWESTVDNRNKGNGCPHCAFWTVESIRLFVSLLMSYIDTLTEAELYVLFQQKGLLNLGSSNKGKDFIQALKTGKFPKEELEKFINKEVSLVYDFFNGDKSKLEFPENLLGSESEIDPLSLDVASQDLKVIEARDVLSAIDNKIYANLDSEAVEFFIESAIAKIWRHAYRNKEQAVQQLSEYKESNEYALKIIQRFQQDYYGTMNMEIPSGYSFPYELNLMQKHVAYLVKKRKRVGNWSGTGAGKTLSAIFASRVINARISVICCPNSVVDNWEKRIYEIFPDSVVYSKQTDLKKINLEQNKNIYLVLNFDFFQQSKAESFLSVLAKNPIDFVVVDEIHYSKQREDKKVSKRRKTLIAFLTALSQSNNNLHILGMSATPVINNLYEGKALLEMVTGIDYSDLSTNPTVANCVSLYQKFILHGIRCIPEYKLKMNEVIIDVDCSDFLPAIRDAKNDILAMEGILTKVKIPTILEHLQPKTIVFTYYRQGIETELYEAIAQRGWRVAMFNGTTKDGLDAFINGNADVLIATSCISTGIDGLQSICNRLIINVLPWTHAEYEQLIGRIYRQGQKNVVDIIIPLTYAMVNNERWSWCQSRWQRIKFKKDIASAAVDGIIPVGHLRTPTQASKDAMMWLERLERGELYNVERKGVVEFLSDREEEIVQRTLSEFVISNQEINSQTSQFTHHRFLSNPQAWHEYHAQYGQIRSTWEVIPYEEAIKWCKARPHLVIGDFGCGEAILAQQVSNKVFSFDHVAINSSVIACDMSNIPLEEEALDVTIYSLSLMGTNWIDYLKEAKRCLKLDGHLWIAEPSSRIKNKELLEELLERLGFDVRRIYEKSKFTFIEALRSERKINDIMVHELNNEQILE